MMSSLNFTPFLSLPRWNLKVPVMGTVDFMLVTDHKSQSRWVLSATSRKEVVASVAQTENSEEPKTTKKTRAKRATLRGKKKATVETDNNSELLASGSVSEQKGSDQETLIGDSEKPKKRTRRKVSSNSLSIEEPKTETKTKRGRKSKKETLEVIDRESDKEVSDSEEALYLTAEESDDADIELVLEKSGDDDISSTYGWPPLVCCFGAAQHAFVPSGKPANRLIDYEIHDRLKDALWTPDNFFRAPGSSAGSVAIALSKVGGRVALMGKLGDDDYGKAMLYYLNANNVQTRSVSFDDKKQTAVSHMKISKRGNLRAMNLKPCAEDSLSRSEINIDVLKEAKMFYVNTSSLLDANMRRTALRAIKIARKLGELIFYDLNLPLPLWQSAEESRSFIEQVWNLADVIEVTKQELEFLCTIQPSDEFDTKNNKKSKFVHYEQDVIAPLWHDNLKLLFVTNGTSKIHYYTKEHDGAVLGVEDAPLTPFTQDMSASGDGIVAAIMRMLTAQPHLITDKEYLERTAKYAINCGVIDQWIAARQCGFPPREGMEEDEDAPDVNGIKTVTEREFRTLRSVAS